MFALKTGFFCSKGFGTNATYWIGWGSPLAAPLATVLKCCWFDLHMGLHLHITYVYKAPLLHRMYIPNVVFLKKKELIIN